MSVKKHFDKIKAEQKRAEDLKKKQKMQEIERQKRLEVEKAAKNMPLERSTSGFSLTS